MVVPERKQHVHRGAAIDLAFDRDRAAMQAHQFVDQRQPDPGALERAAALTLDAVEALEDARDLLPRNADA